jgi:hypothetical protein
MARLQQAQIGIKTGAITCGAGLVKALLL